MKRHVSKTMEAERMVDVLHSAQSFGEIYAVFHSFTINELHDIATAHLPSGLTLIHSLAQREKLMALRALLQQGVPVGTRDARGDTPLHMALDQNCLLSAQVLIGVGGANPSEVMSKRKRTTLLHHMVACDRPSAVKLLLQNKANIDARNHEGRTPFHMAAVYGHSQVAAIFLFHEECEVNAFDGSGQTALMLAILNKNRDLALQLVECSRVDVLLKDPKDRSALHLAVMAAQVGVVRALLTRNSSNLHGRERPMGRAPIHLACALVCSRAGVVTSNCVFDEDEMDEEHASSTERSAHAVSVFQKEVKVDHFINWLLKLEAFNVDTVPRSQDGVRMLKDILSSLLTKRGLQAEHIAHIILELPHDRSSMLRTLRIVLPEIGHLIQGLGDERGHSRGHGRAARGFARTRSGLLHGPTHQAHHSGAMRTESATDYTRGTHCLGTKHSSAMCVGAGKGRAGAQDPMAHPCSPQHRNLSAATWGGPHKMSAAGRKNSWSRSEQSAPSVSFNLDPVESFRMLRRTPSPSVSPSTITQYTIGLVRLRMVALLLDFGADVNLMTSFRKSPLHIACILGANNLVSLLLPRVSNINVPSACNKTALHLAVERNHRAIVAQLLAAGANLKLRDMAGRTALHLAAIHGFPDIIRLLVKVKVDVNMTDVKQMTPIHHAYANNHTSAIQILTSAGAYLDVVDLFGKTPLDYEVKPPGSGLSDPSFMTIDEFSLSESSHLDSESLGESGMDTDMSDSFGFGEHIRMDEDRHPEMSQGEMEVSEQHEEESGMQEMAGLAVDHPQKTGVYDTRPASRKRTVTIQ